MAEGVGGSLLSVWSSIILAAPEKHSTFGNIPKIVKQSYFALFICAASDVFAGYSIAKMAHLLAIYPGLLILVPGLMGMRGNIFGSFGAMLGTSLHTGEIALPYRSSPAMRDQVAGAAVRTLILSLMLAMIVKMFSLVAGVEIMGLHHLILVSTLTGILSGTVLLVFTSLMIAESIRKGWDPDNISLPLITAAGDITTIPLLYLSIVIVLALSDTLVAIASLAVIVLSIVAGVYSITAGRPLLARIIRQSVPILVLCAGLNTVGGIFMGFNMELLLSYAAVLMILPVINAEAGNLGGILSSQLTSAYHLGITRLEIWPDGATKRNFLSLIVLSLLLFPTLGLIAETVAIASGLSSPGIWDLVRICLVAGLAATAFAISITYYLTHIFIKVGVDPDNVVIPILCSSMDVLGTGCLILVAHATI
ncbi:MAG: magnesium transporter [Methanotrichaceae archaeon]|nr:magnesium transporter [Methanotrichaceae archaeon]